MYHDALKKEIIPGIKFWKNPKNEFTVLMLHYSADPDKREGTDWFKKEQKGVLKDIWLKEYEIDFTTKSGKLVYGKDYCDFDPAIHFVDSFSLPEPYELLISLDFGQVHPTCALVGLWTTENRLYIIDEYYKPALPSVSSREMFMKFEYLMGDIGKTFNDRRNAATRTFSIKVIDPSTKFKNRTKIKEGEEVIYSIREEFYDNGWDFDLAFNDVAAGTIRVKEYMKLDNEMKSHLYIFQDKCPNLCRELQNYRYKEQTEAQQRIKNASEEPMKKEDHAADALRYMVCSRPNNPQLAPRPKTRIQKDIENCLRPKVFNDWDII